MNPLQQAKSSASPQLIFVLSIGLLVSSISCRPHLPKEIALAYKNLPAEIDFNFHVKPILSDRCFACHGNDEAELKANLRLNDARSAYQELTDSPGKKAIHPRNLKKSEVFHRIISEHEDVQMPPPDSKLELTPTEKATLIKWIEDGAEYKPHWSFLPLSDEVILPPSNSESIDHPIDRFVSNQLPRVGLKASERADRSTLLRRVAFDLTGLPPSLEELEAFNNDLNADAFEKQIDLFLAKEHYGERMAVNWLDVARFADTHGYLADRYRDMTPWRDFVISAFNRNLPYDQFITWQLAGDLLEGATREQILATGFNRLHQQNAEDGIIDEEFRVAYVSDRTDVLGAGILGLSLACAKCHDHKYDPISQKNYYELYSFFNNINESGLISWEGATPVPALLLPSSRQEKLIASLEAQVKGQEDLIVELTNKEVASIDKFISGRQHLRISPKQLDLGLIAHFDLNDQRLQNQLNRNEKAEMKRQFSSDEKPNFVPGLQGKGLKFDGDAWLDLDNVGIFNRSDPFTVSLFSFIPKNLKDGVIFHKGYGTGLHSYRGFHLHVKGDHLEVMMAHTYPDNAIKKMTTAAIPRDEWTHLALTYDGSSKADGLKVFVDGREQTTVIEIDNLYKDIVFHNLIDAIYPEPIEPGIQFGGRWRGTGFSDGIVDEIKIFSRDLTPLEILQIAAPETVSQILIKDDQALKLEEKAWLKSYYLSHQSPPIQAAKARLTQLRSALVDSIEQVQGVMVMKEMAQPRKAFVLNRGQYDAYGEEVGMNTPERILPWIEGFPKNRLGLAQWVVHPTNPLTARVAVNRYWQMLFGRGLTKTSEDFGNQGSLPDHPELLDWLAHYFIDSGWDIKGLLKLIMTSDTYAQKSVASDHQREMDPENIWLSRGPSKRLIGEMIRDNALAASGLLNDKIGGRSVKPYQPDGLWKIHNLKYASDSGQKLYRRSLYTYWKRSIPNPTLTTFDVPDRNECIVRRQKTTTPLQALALMNDPSFLEAAKVIGEKITQAPVVRTGLAQAFTLLTGRNPSSQEMEHLVQIQSYEVQKFRSRKEKPAGLLESGAYRVDRTLDSDLLAANTVVASVIMSSDATVISR